MAYLEISRQRRRGRWSGAALGRAVRPRHLSLSLRPIALSLRPSAARSSSSCKVKVTSDVLCYNRWGALQQVQCLVESGHDTWLAIIAARASHLRRGLCPACDIRTVKSSWTWVLNLFELYHVPQTPNCVSREPSKVRKQDNAIYLQFQSYFTRGRKSQSIRGRYFSCESEDQVEGIRVHPAQ